MIGAYIVLLPDMTRLRFTNLGESAATGGDKGIYGRLGDPDAPSYAAIDFRLGGGKRLLAGVHLERRAEPRIELTPFLVTGLAEDVALQDVLLDRGEVDVVPDLNRLRELATLSGGRAKTFTRTADYFAELFDRGVTPLRLTSDEERTKLNEMLRTSMVGGISRALTGGLRAFLLKPETGLADTLKGMRGNLDACRRTRVEVETSQRMEEEIHGVYEAGQEMFVAAVHATRERAEEANQRLAAAQQVLDAAEKREQELRDLLDTQETEHAAAKQLLDNAKAAAEEARGALERIRQANRIVERIQHREAERTELVQKVDLSEQASGEALEARTSARHRRNAAQDHLEAATLGLADFQQGLDELHRRAAAFGRASRRLEEARRSLPQEDVKPDSAGPTAKRLDARMSKLDAALVRLDREVSTAGQRRAEHERVVGAVSVLAGDRPAAGEERAAALDVLRRLRRLDVLVEELTELPGRIEEARRLADQQQEAREAAVKLATEDRPLAGQDDVRSAFDACDAALQERQTELAAVRKELLEAEHGWSAAKERVADLEQLLPRWLAIQEHAATLAQDWKVPLSGRPDIAALRERLRDDRDRSRDHLRSLEGRRDATAALSAHLEYGGGEFSPELLAARDAVDGELLAGHFDDVDVDEATRLQAALGPLTEAIVVDDARRAARVLAETETRPDHVWLVDPTTNVSTEADEGGVQRLGDSALVLSDSGSRFSRLPDRPTLGRRARAARITELKMELKAIESEIAEGAVHLRRIDEALAAVNELSADADLFERADPLPELRRAREAVNATQRTRERLEQQGQGLQAIVVDLGSYHAGLRGLLPIAHLLEPPDRRVILSELEERLGDARKARSTLERSKSHRQVVEEGLDVLRNPPPTEEEIDRIRQELDATREQRDALSASFEALRFVWENREAFEWSDAPGALTSKIELRPALEEQLRLAKSRLQQTDAELQRAEQELDSAKEAATEASSELASLDQALVRDHEELSATGVEDASNEALSAADRRCVETQDQVSHIDKRERELSADVTRTRERHETQAKDVERLRDECEERKTDWRPIAERWERLQAEADQSGVLGSAMTPAILERTRSTGSVNLYQEAKTKGSLLGERLAHGEGGGEPAALVRECLDSASQDFGLAYLRAWLGARDWLRHRVPLQIAEVDDPLEALARVRDHLGRLLERLMHQERNLRGQSADVARNIETQRRKARRDVHRLNEDLQDVRFGSIHGVRIQVKPVERLERVLRALKEGAAQQLLFQSEMPIEEAMEELFRTYGGGQIGGQRLLDYREYMDLQVEVRRQASAAWERANPTRMSTGEAIGVGAAIMMVVLTAWERQANLLRSKRAAGTLRLLFLDEANRLSQDNLGVLFELCEVLELQLLIAAPEVGQAEGNTTYHLVRKVDSSGSEVVHVTGRRTPGSRG